MVDGGIINPFPLNRVKRIEGDILIASYVNANIPYNKPAIEKGNGEINNSVYKRKIIEFRNKLNGVLPKNGKEKLNYFSLLTKSTALLTHSLSIMNIEKYKPDMLINISRHSGGTFDFFKAEELIEAGRQAARKSIEQYDKTILIKQNLYK